MTFSANLMSEANLYDLPRRLKRAVRIADDLPPNDSKREWNTWRRRSMGRIFARRSRPARWSSCILASRSLGDSTAIVENIAGTHLADGPGNVLEQTTQRAQPGKRTQERRPVVDRM